MRLHLIRHTSLAVPAGICYGQSDVDVSASFYTELAQLKAKLAQAKFDAVYASPLQRCSKLAYGLDVAPVTLDARLQELHFGDWEMQAWDAIPREKFDVWAQDYAHLSPPNGESFSTLYQRAVGFIEEVSSHSQGEEIAVVTHGGVIRAVLAHALNMPLKGLFRIVVDYGSVTQISFGEAVPRVHFVNR